jgi:acetate kinase
MNILVMNAGSSSQKSCLYNLSADLSADLVADASADPSAVVPDGMVPQPLWEGHIDWTAQPGLATLRVKTVSQRTLQVSYPATERATVLARLLETLWQGETQVIPSPDAIDWVGHRVVHGGAQYRDSVRITAEVKAAIARFADYAPVHNPVNLEGIEAVEALLGEVPQVAVFDTAFHSTLPEVAYTYPGPHEWLAQGIRRYGFHGINHQYVAQRAAQLMQRDLNNLRLITCHLGNGGSLTAVQNGRSIATTMGFTPLEGIMMGSRSGSLDPGILLHLLRQGHSVDDLDRILNKASGLLGISGVGNDMRQIHVAIAQGNLRAKLAFDLFIHRLQSTIASLLPSLGGLDALVFTGGIGENDSLVWQTTCAGLSFLGLKLTEPSSLERSTHDQEIAAPDSTVRVWVIHAQEDWSIAQACWHIARQTLIAPP